MKNDDKRMFQGTVFWGFVLWLFGYVLGIALFSVVPQGMIGYYITPLGVAFTLWVLWKKIKREELMCYFGLGIIWTIIAVILDYLFIVKLFGSAGYYKPDVYLYYALTFFLPVGFGWYRFKVKKGVIARKGVSSRA
ncbi:MAG: hypothetical protein HGB18_05620 [Candidatus Moranbacteria bacterium]|nr:hypothetical protein [Candidatus Moranbacteria bacterium]